MSDAIIVERMPKCILGLISQIVRVGNTVACLVLFISEKTLLHLYLRIHSDGTLVTAVLVEAVSEERFIN